ncbi:MAG: bifunctional UDP-N-acetylglucosamine diphosphorylase/glucosamine-1-phosphate N-acetyltransferase GlmU [Alphaproteobacteria bacterium]|nr:bifunctional UDP-N-acetylglucosamine diphosphorylase/glucosamine-1-phosphate N-acetyltransferase GlmU [Alphaproteobacteria bacterium]
MKESCNSVVILAAGDGSRLKSSLPKVFHKIGGLSLVDHVIRSAKGINPAEIIVVLKPKFADYPLEFGADIKKAYQEKPIGSADTVKCAMPVMNEDGNGYVYVLYADIPLVSFETLQKLYEVAENGNAGVVVLAMDASGSKGLGKLKLAGNTNDGKIQSIVEAKDAQATDNTVPLCNAGLLIKKGLLRKFINKIEPSPITGEFYITKIVEMAYEAGYTCRYFEGSKKELSGANTRSELAQLEQNFQERERQKHMDNGVTLTSPETVFFSFDTVLEQDVTVLPYVVFLKNVHVKTGATVGPFCVLEGSTVNNAQVGPFSRLRTGSEICDGAKIGNFVEIKNSTISEGAKVNHLTYIGDSEVGKSTNIGAGTITCNYDGFKKYRTKIGENVFIGSNTALVAPVEIGDNAMVGAGSVITKDVKSDDLAIARGTQTALEGGSIRFRNSRKG